MRYWLGKPLLMLAGILLVLGGVSVYWLRAGPSPAGANDKSSARTTYHRQVERVMDDLEKGR